MIMVTSVVLSLDTEKLNARGEKSKNKVLLKISAKIQIFCFQTLYNIFHLA